jgi:3-oxoacyl-[acyl-carrier protein] reductase
MGRLQGKVALITGAGSGFGEGIAKGFAKEGANVIIADIAVEGGKRVEAEIESGKVEGSGSAVFLQFDCTKRDAWESGLQLAKDKFGKLDIVCNNAGTVRKTHYSGGQLTNKFNRHTTKSPVSKLLKPSSTKS